MRHQKSSNKVLYKTSIPNSLYLWGLLPVSVLIILLSIGMALSGAIFYALLSILFYFATSPNYCIMHLHQDKIRIQYFRLFNRSIVFDLKDYKLVSFQRGELFNALPFIAKPVRLNDFLEFISKKHSKENETVNVKTNMDDAFRFAEQVNLQLHRMKPSRKKSKPSMVSYAA